MARPELRRPENVPGDFFVDTTCIDCDLCRQMAPETFFSHGDQSAVLQQPQDSAQEFLALQALVACPTASIGALGQHPTREAAASFPIPVEGDVSFCGYASEDSYGASSYFVRRESGNVLVDCPRFAGPLVRRIEALGGLQWILLTHRDDVADHEKWAAHFGAQRVLHRDDARGIGPIEVLLDGAQDQVLDPDWLVIPTPGHTRGHVVYLYRNRYLFTGDHLWSDEAGGVEASYGVCWYSWAHQIQSVQRLLDHQFEWVLPGHGRRFQAAVPQMRAALRNCVLRMQSRAA